MRSLWLVGLWLVPLLTAPGATHAQDRGTQPSRDSVRVMVERRFAARVEKELDLTDDQTSRLKATTDRYAERRRALRSQARELRHALAEQLRPGVAANNDSVTHLTDELVGLRTRYAESFGEELNDMSGYLTAVQRARLFTMRERLFHAARRVRERRQDDGPAVRLRERPGR